MHDQASRPATVPGADRPERNLPLLTRGRRRWPARTDEERRRWRQSGYVSTIVINALLLAVAHELPNWNLPIITTAWAEVLWAIDLALIGGIVAHALFLAHDARWFRDLVQVGLTGLALVAWQTLVRVFPLDLGDAAANDLARLLGTLVIVALVIALLVQVVAWVVTWILRPAR